MKRSLLRGFALLAGAALALSSCATAAPPAEVDAESAASESDWPAEAPAKTAKQRSVTVKVPVLVKESSFYADGLLDEYIVYKYDDSKTRLLEALTYDAARPEPIERLACEWKDGRKAAESVFDAEGKLKLRREFGYDAAGRLLSERVLDARGQAQSSSSYAYDAAGQKTEWRAFDGSGALRALTLYSEKAIEMRGSGGAATGSILLERLPDGRISKRSYLAADGSTQKVELYLYGKAPGPEAIETRRADGSLASKTSYAYGEAGAVLKSATLDGGGAVRDSRSYEYALREETRTETYYE